MIARIRVSDPDAKPLPRIRPTKLSPKRSSEGSILDCIHDPELFASWFDSDWQSWQAWLAFLAALFALPMDAEQLAIYRDCTGRKNAPDQIAREAWLICGRRAGKSFVLALVAVFLAAFFDYRPYLSPGERGTILVIAADRKQSRVILRYIAALLKGVPMLASLVTRETAEGFDLSNGVSIEVATCSFRSVRGYLAKFRSDIEAFITREAVQACISAGTYERGRIDGVSYSAFCDPSGGSSDSMTLAIASKQNGIATLDAVRERKPPFSPEEVVGEFALLLKSYGIMRVLGDKYAGEWVREPFRAHGITYDAAARPKSDLYRDFLPLVNSKKADLLDHPKMLQQLVSLERRVARSGKDSIDHPPGAHDDVCNAVAGAIVNVGASKYAYDSSLSWVGTDEEMETEFRAGRLSRYLFSGGFLR